MEPVSKNERNKIFCIKAGFDWVDIGSWSSIEEIYDKIKVNYPDYNVKEYRSCGYRGYQISSSTPILQRGFFGVKKMNTKEKVIVIVNAQYNGTKENPYTFEQRKIMIEKTLSGELKNKYRIVAIPDVHSNDLWVDHVLNIVGELSDVYTGNELVKELFLAKKFQVKPVKIYKNITATKIRSLLRQGDENWREMVPKALVEILNCYPN